MRRRYSSATGTGMAQRVQQNRIRGLRPNSGQRQQPRAKHCGRHGCQLLQRAAEFRVQQLHKRLQRGGLARVKSAGLDQPLQFPERKRAQPRTSTPLPHADSRASAPRPSTRCSASGTHPVSLRRAFLQATTSAAHMLRPAGRASSAPACRVRFCTALHFNRPRRRAIAAAPSTPQSSPCAAAASASGTWPAACREIESAVCASGSFGVSAVSASAAPIDCSSFPASRSAPDQPVMSLKVLRIGIHGRSKGLGGARRLSAGQQVKPLLAERFGVGLLGRGHGSL